MPSTRVVRINPQASSVFVGWTKVGYTTSSEVGITDGLDSTYLSEGGVFPQKHQGIWPMADATIPTGAKIWMVESVIRYRELTGKAFQATPQHWTGIGQRLAKGGVVYINWNHVNALNSSFITYTFGNWQKPTGGEWSLADVNALEMEIIVFQQPDPQDQEIAEAYFNVYYNAKPIVTVTSPTEGGTITDTTKPLVKWDWADDEGDPQEAYQIKIFNDAQYLASGFNPDTSTPWWTSGKVYSATREVRVSISLPNDTYRAYVKGWQPWPYEFASDYDNNTFTINVTPPATPTLTLTNNPTNADGPYTQVVVGNLTSGNKYDVEFSDDFGTTWTRHPRLSGTATSTSHTRFDFETPPSTGRLYRAKQTRILADLDIDSLYTGVASSTAMTVTEWWLIDLDNSLNNLKLFVTGDSLDTKEPEAAAAFSPLGRDYKIIVSDTIYGEEFDLLIHFINQADYNDFQKLRHMQKTLLLKSPMSGQQWYVRIKGDRNTKLLNTAEPWREVSVNVIEQAMPL